MDLLERDARQAHREEHRRLAAAGQGRLALVGGEDGAGKTALVDAFAGRASDAAGVLRMSCDALSTPSRFGSARDLAPALGLRVKRMPLDGGDRDRLFRARLNAFAARPEPPVVIGEDAHWADSASLEPLRFLSRRIGAWPLLLVITYRDDEVGPTTRCARFSAIWPPRRPSIAWRSGHCRKRRSAPRRARVSATLRHCIG